MQRGTEFGIHVHVDRILKMLTVPYMRWASFAITSVHEVQVPGWCVLKQRWAGDLSRDKAAEHNSPLV